MIRILVLSLILAIAGLTSCKTSQFTVESGMYKVAILYPGGDDKSFDLDYYEDKHMPMVAAFLGKNLKFCEIDKGVAGRKPDDKAPFVAIGYFYVYDIQAYYNAIAPNRAAIVADFANYTNIQPIVQISKINRLEHRNRR